MIPKKKILCFIDFYLPGYKSGGPVRSITNFVEQLGNLYDISIVCRDHDASDKASYKEITKDSWNKVGNASVFYASKNTLTFRGLKRILAETPYDLLYLNSFFSYRFTILPLFLRFLKFIPKKPIILAPRGELSPGALKIKLIKKKIYIFVVKFFGFYKNLYWQASSSFEKKDILSNLSNINKTKIFIAPNLTPIIQYKKNFLQRKDGKLRIVFLSRISPKKNLDFLLSVMLRVKESIDLAIYGVKSDEKYYKHCMNLIYKLPKNINAEYKGHVPHKEVLSILSNYDLFVFPTKGENFGHVIFESLSAGTPVLVSDQTPWYPDNNGSLQVLELNQHKWVKVINDWSKFDNKILIQNRQNAINYIKSYNLNNFSLKKNKELFSSILNISIV